MHPSNSPRTPRPIRFWPLQPIQLAAIDLNDWLFRFVVINLLWALLSVTVILLPPATAALFDTAHQAYRGQKPEVRRFLASVRRWFVKSWIWAAANVIIFGAIMLLVLAVSDSEILLGVIAVIAALVVIVQFYFWPYMMIQDAPLLARALKNSAFTAFGGLLYMTFYLAITLIILIPSVIVIAPLFLIAPVVLSVLITYSLIVWLQHYHLIKEPAREL